MTVKECANIMGITPRKLRIGIDNGMYFFGKVIIRDSRNTYYIDKNLFNLYMKGERYEQ